MPTHTRLAAIWAMIGILAALAWSMVRSGFIMTSVPEDLVAAAAIWPQRTESWMTQFYADSPLYILSARVLGLEDNIGIIRQGFIVSLIAVVVLAAWAARVTPTGQRARASRLALLAPISAILFSTIGSYDAFTALVWAVAMWLWLTGSRTALVLAGALLGIQHFEQSGLGVVALLCTWFALRNQLPDPLGKLSPAWMLPGLVAGKAVVVLVLVLNGQSATGRAQWLSTYLLEWTKVGLATLPYLAWSLFAGFWLLLFMLWSRSGARARWFLLAALATGLIGMGTSGDRPRVFVLILLPSLLVAITVYLREPDRPRLELRAVEALAWIGPPVILAGKIALNSTIIDNGYVSFMWLTGLGGPG